jgi:hypothetical protein
MVIDYCCQEMEVCYCRRVCIVRSSAGCEDQPYNCVHREGREEERKEREV